MLVTATEGDMAAGDTSVDSAGEPSQAPYGNHPGTQPRTLGV